MNFQERKAYAARTARLREAGLCEKCGSRPVGTNQDGSTSRSCDFCKARKNTPPVGRLTIAKMKDTRKKPPRSDEWGIDVVGWDESQEYLEYAAQVGVLILNAHGPWIGDPGIRVARINEWFGDNVNREWTASAIRGLLATGVISRSWVIPYRYSRNIKSPLKELRYLTERLDKSGKRKAMGISIEPKRSSIPY